MPAQPLHGLMMALAVLLFVSFGTAARACEPGARVEGTTTIRKVSVQDHAVLFLVEKFSPCGITMVVVPIHLTTTSGSCKAGAQGGSTIVVAGVVRIIGDEQKALYLAVDSLRCS